MWQRWRKKYLSVVILVLVAYPISYVPAIYCLVNYAPQTERSIQTFQAFYRIPLKVIPQTLSVAMIRLSGVDRWKATLLDSRLRLSGPQVY